MPWSRRSFSRSLVKFGPLTAGGDQVVTQSNRLGTKIRLMIEMEPVDDFAENLILKHE